MASTAARIAAVARDAFRRLEAAVAGLLAGNPQLQPIPLPVTRHDRAASAQQRMRAAARRY